MTHAWRIKIDGQPRQKPDAKLLARAVLALAEQLQRETQSDERGQHDALRPIGDVDETEQAP